MTHWMRRKKKTTNKPHFGGTHQSLRISDSKHSILMNRRAAPERAPCFHMPSQKGGCVNVHCVKPVPDTLYL